MTESRFSWRRPPKRRAKRRAGDKRDRILKAAVKVFARNGFHATRVSEVAKAAGVADGTIYLYFKSKEELLFSLFEDRIEQAPRVHARQLPKQPSARDRLRAVIDMQLGLLEGERELAEVITVILRQSTRLMKEFAAPHFLAYLDAIAKNRPRVRRPATSGPTSRRTSPRARSSARSTASRSRGRSAAPSKARSRARRRSSPTSCSAAWRRAGSESAARSRPEPGASIAAAMVAALVVALMAAAAGMARVLPMLLNPEVPSRAARPFLFGVLALSCEVGFLVGWPLGWAEVAVRSRERGEARARLALGESPVRRMPSVSGRQSRSCRS